MYVLFWVTDWDVPESSTINVQHTPNLWNMRRPLCIRHKYGILINGRYAQFSLQYLHTRLRKILWSYPLYLSIRMMWNMFHYDWRPWKCDFNHWNKGDIWAIIFLSPHYVFKCYTYVDVVKVLEHGSFSKFTILKSENTKK